MFNRSCSFDMTGFKAAGTDVFYPRNLETNALFETKFVIGPAKAKKLLFITKEQSTSMMRSCSTSFDGINDRSG